MNNKKMLTIMTVISGLAFILLLSLLLKNNTPQKTITIDTDAQMFKAPPNTILNSSEALKPIQNKRGFNIGSADFKVFFEKSNDVYILKCEHNRTTKYLMNFYEQPSFNYGIFDDSKSFWIVVGSSVNSTKYTVYAFYNIYNPRAVKIYENDTDEDFNSLRLEYKKDLITILSPSGKVNISKFGQVTKE